MTRDSPSDGSPERPGTALMCDGGSDWGRLLCDGGSDRGRLCWMKNACIFRTAEPSPRNQDVEPRLCARSPASRSSVPSLCDGLPSITPAAVGPRLGVAVVRPRALCARPPASRSPVPSLCGGPSVNHSPVAVCAARSPKGGTNGQKFRLRQTIGIAYETLFCNRVSR